ncbi:MAG: hypothetical protein ABIV47_01695, partial [Roseiflexaceae bacterium]
RCVRRWPCWARWRFWICKMAIFDDIGATMSHPLLQSYAETLQQTFPLILVIGREPNTNLPISDQHGQYNFDDYPRCAFWNISYSTVAATVQLTAAELKSHCRKQRGSPILYADALPIGLKHSVADKHGQRARLEAHAIRDHIAAVFAYRPLLDRVGLVIVSGLEAAVFEPARSAIAIQCDNQRIPHYQLPFFFGNNAPRIRVAMTGELRDRLQATMLTFTQLAQT